MTTVLLVRHATGDHVGRVLAGRVPGTRLSEEGRRQAERLAERLAARPVRAVYASPLERARETAEPIAARFGLTLYEAPGLMELDFGRWTGRPIDGFGDDADWRHFNTYRSGTRIPGGELLLEAQSRAVAELLRLCERHPHETIVAVSHADVIRALLGHFAGVPIDLLLRFEIDPASVTELELHDWGARIVCVNERGT
ncbi:MAG TPA: histidine phosphatase family protein [Gemmatimonadaceae bacterium]|nr:histidine phosphatase family protein [Gemmatimonadaceae bacterium]